MRSKHSLNKNFSVVIPTKNEEENIERLLKSISEQSIQPKEIIIADDSTDGTRVIAAKYPDVRITQGTSDGRIGKGRNLGAKHVTTDLIYFIDADTLLPENFFENTARVFLIKDLDIATTFIAPIEASFFTGASYSIYNILKAIQAKAKLILSETGICLIISKAAFKKIKGFSESLRNAEDVDIITRSIKKDLKFETIPFKIYTSTRRIKNKKNVDILKLFVTAIGMGLLVNFGWKFLKNKQEKLESMYGETGGTRKNSGKNA